MTTRQIIRAAAFVVVSGVVLISIGLVYFYRPLIPTSAWRPKVTHQTENTTSAKVYEVLFKPDRFFIKVLDSSGEHWFSVDTHRRADRR